PEQTLWNHGSIWWDATVQGSENNSIVIDLQGIYHITGIITQADNNDNYRIDYFNPNTNSWTELGSWRAVAGWGLMTRPSGDHVTQYPVDFDASQFRLSAFGGDSFYAYSEFQAFGTRAVPEPSTMILLGAGIAGLAIWRRKKQA
ncbi:MAG TPA: PEP-CTERM sorting domain-containing protein, partial [Geobacteraceae bacterium]